MSDKIKHSGTVDTETQVPGSDRRTTPSLSVRELLDVWYRRAREAQFAHYRAAKRFSLLNNVLGILSALMAAGLGLQLVQVLNIGSWLNLRTQTLDLALGVSGLIAAALTTIQTLCAMRNCQKDISGLRGSIAPFAGKSKRQGRFPRIRLKATAQS